jgi:hypothetical protein
MSSTCKLPATSTLGRLLLLLLHHRPLRALKGFPLVQAQTAGSRQEPATKWPTNCKYHARLFNQRFGGLHEKEYNSGQRLSDYQTPSTPWANLIYDSPGAFMSINIKVSQTGTNYSRQQHWCLYAEAWSDYSWLSYAWMALHAQLASTCKQGRGICAYACAYRSRHEGNYVHAFIN